MAYIGKQDDFYVIVIDVSYNPIISCNYIKTSDIVSIFIPKNAIYNIKCIILFINFV